jgi:hypothetical protein
MTRINASERLVGKRQPCRVHSEQLDIVPTVDVSCRFMQHRLGHLDTSDAAIVGIEQSREAGANPYSRIGAMDCLATFRY